MAALFVVILLVMEKCCESGGGGLLALSEKSRCVVVNMGTRAKQGDNNPTSWSGLVLKTAAEEGVGIPQNRMISCRS